MSSDDQFDYSCKCPNVTIFFKGELSKPLRNTKISINASSKKSLITDGLGKVSYYEDTFPADGALVVEYNNGAKNVEWKTKLPLAAGIYTIPVCMWSNIKEEG